LIYESPLLALANTFFPSIQVKEVNFSYSIDKVFLDIPNLQHVNDGLIYTAVSTPYVPGTDRNLFVLHLCQSPFKLDNPFDRLKWKPPSENSIDFKLVLRFPSLPGSPNKPDLQAKPIFALHVWCGGEGAKANYEPWDTMHVSDDEWERYAVTPARLFVSRDGW
jgi:mRNA guanylyltransferase